MNFSETSQYKIPIEERGSGWNFILLHLQQCLLSVWLLGIFLLVFKARSPITLRALKIPPQAS